MTFVDLLPGQSVFLDANTLVYHFQPHPVFGPVCHQLVARIEQQDLAGFTSTHILSEVSHRLMMIEASALPGWSPTKVKQRLQRQPHVVDGGTQAHLRQGGVRLLATGEVRSFAMRGEGIG